MEARQNQKGQDHGRTPEFVQGGGGLKLFIFRPTQIRYTPLLTHAKSAILHIRPTCDERVSVIENLFLFPVFWLIAT